MGWAGGPNLNGGGSDKGGLIVHWVLKHHKKGKGGTMLFKKKSGIGADTDWVYLFLFIKFRNGPSPSQRDSRKCADKIITIKTIYIKFKFLKEAKMIHSFHHERPKAAAQGYCRLRWAED